jgi:prepilin-type processing-associated H-X9-DG protein
VGNNVWWYVPIQGDTTYGYQGYVPGEAAWVCSKERYGDTTYSMPDWRTEWTTMWAPDRSVDPTKSMLVGESAYRGYGRFEWMKHPHDMAFSWGPDRFAGVLHTEYCGHQGGNNVAYMDGHAKWIEVHQWLVDFDPTNGYSGWYQN